MHAISAAENFIPSLLLIAASPVVKKCAGFFQQKTFERNSACFGISAKRREKTFIDCLCLETPSLHTRRRKTQSLVSADERT